MIDWLKKWLLPQRKRETPEERLRRIHALMPDALGALGDMMGTGPTFVFPASKLPLPKEEMKIAVKLAWASTKDKTMRNHLSVAYASLSQFQEDASTPFEMPSFRADPEILCKPHSMELIYLLAVENRAMAEMKALIDEFSEFERSATKPDPSSYSNIDVTTPTGKICVRPDARSEITLTEKSDVAELTYLHGPEFLKQLCQDARHPEAPKSLRDDLVIILEWLQVSSTDQIAVEHYEQFARGWQLYIWEGIAPTPGLSETFANSKKWMRERYPNKESLNVDLTLEVRGVFARMLSS
jgi:hypothetical protein